MAAPLEESTKKEQRAVIRFLGSEGEKPVDIHRRMKRQYGNVCMSLRQVYEWHKKFKSGVSNLADAARSGRPHTANRPDINSKVERMIRENRRVTIDEVAGELKISHGSAHHIIHNVLQYRKVSISGSEDKNMQISRENVPADTEQVKQETKQQEIKEWKKAYSDEDDDDDDDFDDDDDDKVDVNPVKKKRVPCGVSPATPVENRDAVNHSSQTSKSKTVKSLKSSKSSEPVKGQVLRKGLSDLRTDEFLSKNFPEHKRNVASKTGNGLPTAAMGSNEDTMAQGLNEVSESGMDCQIMALDYNVTDNDYSVTFHKGDSDLSKNKSYIFRKDILGSDVLLRNGKNMMEVKYI